MRLDTGLSRSDRRLLRESAAYYLTPPTQRLAQSQVAKVSPGQFVCAVCGKTSKRRSVLVAHALKTHAE